MFYLFFQKILCARYVLAAPYFYFFANFLLVIELADTYPKRGKRIKNQKAYSTWGSKAVAQPSTIQARRGLTSVIGREPVLSAWYGRKPKASCKYEYMNVFEPCLSDTFLMLSSESGRHTSICTMTSGLTFAKFPKAP